MDGNSIFYFLIGLVGILLFVKLYRYWTKKNYWADYNLPYVDPPLSLLFFNLFSKKQYWDLDTEWCREKGRIFGATQVNKPCLYVTEPEIIRRLLVKDFHLLSERRKILMNDPIADRFLSLLTGDDWKRVRSLISPAFTTVKLKKMVALMNECSVMTAENLTRIAENEGITDCKEIFGGFTLDIIANTAFGTKLNSAKDPDNIFIQHARQFFNVTFPWRIMLVMFFPKLAKMLGISAFNPKLMKFFTELTNTVVEKRKASKEDRGDFLQNLLDAQLKGVEEVDHQGEEDTLVGTDNDTPSEESQSFLKQYSKNKTLSTEEFVAACILFFLAGFDTAATTVSMTTYFLALNPECQAKVVEEVDEIWKKYPTLDYEAFSKVKYLDAVISETLRLVPPAPRLERRVLEDYRIEEANFTVPQDMMVEIPIYAMHTDPEFFPDPEKYDPERFLPENKDTIRPYTYLPFGAGPRNCIGMRLALMEIKVCLLHVFREVTFEPCAETKIPPEIYKGSGLYQPKTVNLKVIKRN